MKRLIADNRYGGFKASVPPDQRFVVLGGTCSCLEINWRRC